MTRRGFTLVELMVVLGVIILLLAMILPTIGPMQRRGRMNDAATRAGSAFREARTKAIATSTDCTVDFPDAARIRWQWVTKYLGGAGTPPAGARWAPDIPVGDPYAGYRHESVWILPESAMVTLPDGVHIDGALPAPVVFYPDGSCGGVTIILKGPQNAGVKKITVGGSSGRVAVENL